MTNRDIRSVIGKKLGWKFHPPPIGGISTADWELPTGGYSSYGPPDYQNSLEAIHMAVEDAIVGNAELEKRFIKELNQILDRQADDDTICICEYEMAQIQASAQDRAEAFCRTFGIWEEKP